MGKVLLVFSVLYSLSLQIQPQILRPPLGLLNRPLTEALLESPRNFIEAPRPYTEIPRNYIEFLPEPSRNYINVPRIIEQPRYIDQANLPYANVPTVPTTTIISDCTPSVCKNLANTINLMIVCNLLKNTKGSDEIALQVAAPLLKEIISNPTRAVSSTTTGSSLLNANSIVPNVAPSYISPNMISPNVISPDVITPNYIAPNSVAPCNAQNNAALISSLLKLLTGSS